MEREKREEEEEEYSMRATGVKGLLVRRRPDGDRDGRGLHHEEHLPSLVVGVFVGDYRPPSWPRR
jgi:hypothetical protein